MNILFLLNIGFDRPGPSVHILQSIMRKCLERGDTLRVILRNSGGELSDAPDFLAKNANYSYSLIYSKNIYKMNLLHRYFNEIRYVYSCSKIYSSFNDFDVIFLQSTTVPYFHLRLLKRKFKCPVLFNVQDIFPDNLREIGVLGRKNPTFIFFEYLQILGYRKADHIITISMDMIETLKAKGISKEKLSCIYNWSYSDTLISIPKTENRFTTDNKINKTKFNIFYAGNIGRMQNAEIIISAAKLLTHNSEIKFYIIGDGIYKNKLIAEGSNLTNLTFLPFQPAEIAESIYSAADVNIIPLAKGVIKTALPSKTPTCLRANRPIIFCIGKESKFAELLSRYKGLIVTSSDDPQDLANAIVSLKQKSGLKVEAYNFFCKYFTLEKNSEEYVEILHEIALSGKKA